MRIVFFGTSAFGIPTLEGLKASPHELALAVTTPDRPQGRDLKLEASPVKRWATDHRIALCEVTEIRSAKFLDEIRKTCADLFVVVSFGLILPRALLEVPGLMTLNVHPSLLPRYRGAAPMHWALINGDPQTGVTVMRITEKLDAGDILLQKKTALTPADDIHSLETRLSQAGAEALLEAIAQVGASRAKFIPQEEAQASYARKLTKADGHIDWKKSAHEIQNRIRAMKDWPTSYTFYEGRRLIVEEVGLNESGRLKGIKAGLVLDASKEKGIWVASADFPVEIRVLKPEGREALAARDFLNGTRLEAGRFFE